VVVVMAEAVVVLIFRMWDLNFGTWISLSGLHMIQEARDFTVSEGDGHPLVSLDITKLHINKILLTYRDN
jgi:hypothetical protein